MTPMLELRQVSKITATARPRCTRFATSTCRSRRVSWWRSWGRAGRARAACSRSPAASKTRPTARSRRRRLAHRHVAQRQGPAAAAFDRLRLPGLQPARRADRGRERRHAARARRHAGTRGARHAIDRARGAGVARPRRALPRRPLRRRASAGRDRPRRGRRAPPLLADEPTGALDSVNSEAVMRLLATVCSRGRRGRGDPRGPARIVGQPGRVPARRAARRPDRTPDGPESLLLPAPRTLIVMSARSGGPGSPAPCCAGLGGCSAASGGSRSLCSALVTVAVAAAVGCATSR